MKNNIKAPMVARDGHRPGRDVVGLDSFRHPGPARSGRPAVHITEFVDPLTEVPVVPPAVPGPIT